MNWNELLESEMETAYRATEGLMRRVDDGALGWKPAQGANWMTTGQLLKHLTESCGALFRGFVAGDWGFRGDPETGEMSRDVPAGRIAAATTTRRSSSTT